MNKNLRKFILATIVISLASTAGYLIAPIEVRFLQTLTANTTLIGLTFGIGSLFFAILSIYLGRLSDRVGRQRFLIVGPLLGIIYPLLYAFSFNVFQYMGLRIVWAASAVATGPIFLAYIQDILKDFKNKGRKLGYVFAAQSILGALAAFLGGYLSDKFGLRAPYFAMSIIFVLATILTLFSGFKEKVTVKDKKNRSIFFSLQYIFKKPALIFYFLENTVFGLNWGIKPMLFPLIIFGMTKSDAMTGSVFATMGIVAFFMLLFAGKIVDRIGIYYSLFLSFLILGVSGVFLFASWNILMFWAAAAVFAIGEALHGPAQAVNLTENIESRYRGEILAFDSVIDSSINAISPLLAGFLLVYFLPQTVLFFYVVLFWIALAVLKIYYCKTIKPTL